MRVLIFLTLLLLSHVTFCQETTTPKRVIGTFIFKGEAYNYELKGSSSDNYSLSITAVRPKEEKTAMETDTTALNEVRVDEENQSDKQKEENPKPEANPKPENNPDGTDEEADAEESQEPDFIFSELSTDILQSEIVKQMIKNFNAADDDDLDDFAITQAIKIKARFDFLDDEPVTANLILRDDYISSLLKYNSSPYYTGVLSNLVVGHRVKSVRVETEDGAIKNIIAQFIAPKIKTNDASPRQYVEFKNTFPISISGKFDPQHFAKIRLYCLNCWGVKGLDRFIKLSDLLALDITLENGKEDYSPVNSTVELNPNHPIAELKKEKRSRIIEVAAFTDFVGLDQEEPNGLLQFEAKRRININTTSHSLRKFETEDEISNQMNIGSMREVRRIPGKKEITYVYKRKWNNAETFVSESKNIKIDTLHEKTKTKSGKDTTVAMAYYTYKLSSKRKFGSSFMTLFNSIEPRLLFSKLEENQRFIDSLSLQDNKIDPVKLFKHQLVSFGVSANLLKLTFPQPKFTWNVISVGGYWFRSRVGFSSDSSRASIPLNNAYLLFSSELVFRPDSRWGATFGGNLIKPSIWNGEYELSNNNAIIQPYVDAFLKTNDTDRLFFRFRWSFERTHKENNFTQIQLGYNVNLFADTSKNKKQNSDK